MKNKLRFDARLTATGGMLTALCFVFCLAGSFLPFTKILAPCACGILLAVIMQYVSASVAVLSYTAASVLMLLFLPDKLTAGAFACLLGYYPMAFRGFSALKNVWLRAVLKLLLFSSVSAGAFFIGTELMGLGVNERIQKYAWLLIILCCLFFVLYDRFLCAFYKSMEKEWDKGLRSFFRRFR